MIFERLGGMTSPRPEKILVSLPAPWAENAALIS
jgi:hypothetical protein